MTAATSGAGPSEPPTVRGSIARVLDAALATNPDGEALVGHSGRLSYRELDVAADRASSSTSSPSSP